MIELAKKYGREKAAIKIAENKIKKRKQDLAKMETELFSVITESGLTSFSTEDQTFFSRVDRYASVDMSQAEIAFDFLKEYGYGHIIKPSVNARTLTSAIKDIEDQTGIVLGKDNGINVREVERVGVRKK